MIRYVFRDDPVILHNGKDADPQAIGEALDAIAAANGGRLTPNATVAAAGNRRHPLHKHFEWRNEKAAEAYRLQQARNLIRCLRVVDTDLATARPAHAWLSITEHKGSGRSYVPVNKIITSAFLQSRALELAIKDLDAFEKRYREIADLCVEIREWRARLSERRRAILDDPAPEREYGT